MYRQFPFYKTLFSIIFIFILASCGGGDGDSGSNVRPPDRVTGTIQGVVFDAPVAGASVTAWEFKDGRKGRPLASGRSDSRGYYSLKVTSGSMPVLIEARGGVYVDPVTQAMVSSSNGKSLAFDTVFNYAEGDNASVMITPLTHMIKGLAEYRSRKGQHYVTALNAATHNVNSMYGFDVIRVQPVDITKGGQSTVASEGHKYGALLTAYSSYAGEQLARYSATDESKDIYTSFHLSDIQYRDVSSTGKLDGYEVDLLSGIEKPISFGRVRVSSDLYTNKLSQHVMVAVNSSDLNKSGTESGDYIGFAESINKLGTRADDGVVPSRDEINIDSDAPQIERDGSDVLAKVDQVSVSLTDYIGLKGVTVAIQYYSEGSWSPLINCPVDGFGDGFCHQAQEAISGKRAATVPVEVNTLVLDQQNATQARLVIKARDALDNETVGDGTHLNFSWDNKVPVIKISSSPTFNPNNKQNYLLEGTIAEAFSSILTPRYQVGSDPAIDLTCTTVTSGNGDHCVFSKEVSEAKFNSGMTKITVTAFDELGNEGRKTIEVLSDVTDPMLSVSYPAGNMKFIRPGVGGEPQLSYEPYTRATFASIDEQKYLNIDYKYAKDGLKVSHPTLDFNAFNPRILDINHVPYIRLRVSDSAGEKGFSATSAEKLLVTVKYTVYDGDQLVNTNIVESKTHSIPHELIEFQDTYADSVTYYIPYVKEMFGSEFKQFNENLTQKLNITVTDESGNETQYESEIQFRSTFNLPKISVTTPFINAKVDFEVFADNGQMQYAGSCITTASRLISNPAKSSLDIAGCSVNSEYVGQVVKVSLHSQGDSTYHNQWRKKTKTVAKFSPNSELSAYFLLKDSVELYISELAVYQSGYFDYLWNNSNEKNRQVAKDILVSVDDMLTQGAGTFFGFHPVHTAYASNEEMERLIPQRPGDKYQHRFLLEALVEMSDNSQIHSSVDFAKAFYDDFSFDGKPNGKGASGQIALDRYALSSDTYRKDLANYYYEYVTKEVKIDSSIAMGYANLFSKADPKLNGEKLFTESGGSIDILPPSVNASPESGRKLYENEQWYIAGGITSLLELSDPSGINQTDRAPRVEIFWEDAVNRQPVPVEGVFLVPDPANDRYNMRYRFDFQSDLPAYDNIARLAMKFSASDLEGNNYGYSEEPYEKVYVVDNEAPTVSYVSPFPVGPGYDYDEDSFLNLKSVHEPKFVITDVVGDVTDKRRILLNSGIHKIRELGPDNFYKNDQGQLILKLGNNAGDDPKVISLEDGLWTLVLETEDRLGNKVTAQDVNAPKFKLNIDSKEPEVTSNLVSHFIDGNSTWSPNNIIKWTASPAKDIEVKLTRPGFLPLDLTTCEDSQNCTQRPAYLVGEKPNYKVQLVAEHFDHGKENSFHVKASNDAYPSNSASGIHKFKVDKNGPEFELSAEPGPVVDMQTKSTVVMGRVFDIKFVKAVDDSSVEKINIYQRLNDGSEVKLLANGVKPESPEQPFDIRLNKADTDIIQLQGEDKSITLLAKGMDKYGSEGSSNVIRTKFDKEGPGISLTNFTSGDNSFYKADKGFNFILSTLDYAKDGTWSKEGVVSADTCYWIYSGSEPEPGDACRSLQGSDEIKFVADQDSSIKISAKDIRGNVSEKVFGPIKVNNTKPMASSEFKYLGSAEPIKSETVTKKEPVNVFVAATDLSGIASVEGRYKLLDTEGDSSTLSFSPSEAGKDIWQGILPPLADGVYAIEIDVMSKTRVNPGESQAITTRLRPQLRVQTEGIELKAPEGFNAHTSGSTLDVTFSTDSPVSLKKLECWVREEYNSQQAPEAGVQPYYSAEGSQVPQCIVENMDKNYTRAPVVLITKTTGSNGAENTQNFTFNMVDIEPPYVKDQEKLTLKKDWVRILSEGDKRVKRLELSVDILDDHSNLNIDSSALPKLKALSGDFAAKECTQLSGGAGQQGYRCTYNEIYDDIIDPINLQKKVELLDVADKAGNVLYNKDVILDMPKGKFTSEITTLKSDQYISGDKIEFDFKISLFVESKMDNVFVTVGEDTYNFVEHRELFSDMQPCTPNNPSELCSAFSGTLSAGYDEENVTVELEAVDIWGNKAGHSIILKLDNKTPEIKAEYKVRPAEGLPHKTRLEFNVSDPVPGSGLKEVTYRFGISGNEHKVPKTENFSYLDIDSSLIHGMTQLKVDIAATDNVGLYKSETIVVDLRSPAVTLDLGGESELVDTNIVYRKRQQDITVKALSPPDSGIVPDSLNLTLIRDSDETGEKLVDVDGTFTGDTATLQVSLPDDRQGRYITKLVVTDSIGRKTTTFTYKDTPFSESGAGSYIDFAKPEIGAIVFEQSDMTPQNGAYNIGVKAVVTDPNLNKNSVNAVLKQGEISIPMVLKTLPGNPEDPYVFEARVKPGVYTIQIRASDLTKQEAVQTAENITVKAATTPALTISVDKSELGGGKTTQVTFTFSEPVVNFTPDDVLLKTHDGSDAGQLDTTGWTEGPGESWSAQYTSPTGTDKLVTIWVDEGSYESENTIPGKKSEKVIDVKGLLPVVEKVTFDPPHANPQDTVVVKAKFSTEVTGAKITVGGETVEMDVSESDKALYKKTIKVPQAGGSDLSVPVTIKDFTDSYGNEGLVDSSFGLPLTPALTITYPTGVINADLAANMLVRGTSTRFTEGQIVTVEFRDSATADESTPAGKSTTAVIQRDGTWAIERLDITGLTGESINIKVSGQNAQQIDATDSVTRELDIHKPTVQTVSYDPAHQLPGQPVTVTAIFDQGVKAAQVTLGGNTKTMSQGFSAREWTAVVNLPNVAGDEQTLPVTVHDYVDLNDNRGDEHTAEPLPLTPALTITYPTGVINADLAVNMLVRGTSTRFTEGQIVTVEFRDSATADESTPAGKSTTAVIQRDGTWAIERLDITGLTGESINIKVSGQNAQQIDATDSVTRELDIHKPTVQTVSYDPAHQLPGQPVTVTAIFDQGVKAAQVTLGGNTRTMSQGSSAREWTAVVNLPNVAGDEQTLPVTVHDYVDLNDNRGDEYTAEPLPLTPALTITYPTGVINADLAVNMLVEGTSTRFTEGQIVTVEFRDSATADESTPAGKSTTAFIQRDGTWATERLDITGLTGESINIKVSGQNAQLIDAADSVTRELDIHKPTVQTVSYDPAHQLPGQPVTVTVIFDQDVKAAQVTLGGNTKTMSQGSSAREWTAVVNLPNVAGDEQTLPVTVHDYVDLNDNRGDEHTAEPLPLTPALTITYPTGVINADLAVNMLVEGTSTRFTEGQIVTVEFRDSATADESTPAGKSTTAFIQRDGTWAIERLDITGLTGESINIKVSGQNAQQIDATDSVTRELDINKPTVQTVSYDPVHQLPGQPVTVTAIFDQDVKAAQVTLGGNTKTMSQGSSAREWTAVVNLPNVAGDEQTLPVTVHDYVDLNDNRGDEHTAEPLPLTPALTITYPTGVINADLAVNMLVEGTSTRFTEGQIVTVEFRDSATADESTPAGKSTTAFIQRDGTWAIDRLDITGLTGDSINIKVSGQNAQQIDAADSVTRELDINKPTVQTVSYDPAHQLPGQLLNITTHPLKHAA